MQRLFVTDARHRCVRSFVRRREPCISATVVARRHTFVRSSRTIIIRAVAAADIGLRRCRRCLWRSQIVLFACDKPTAAVIERRWTREMLIRMTRYLASGRRFNVYADAVLNLVLIQCLGMQLCFAFSVHLPLSDGLLDENGGLRRFAFLLDMFLIWVMTKCRFLYYVGINNV